MGSDSESEGPLKKCVPSQYSCLERSPRGRGTQWAASDGAGGTRLVTALPRRCCGGFIPAVSAILYSPAPAFYLCELTYSGHFPQATQYVAAYLAHSSVFTRFIYTALSCLPSFLCVGFLASNRQTTFICRSSAENALDISMRWLYANNCCEFRRVVLCVDEVTVSAKAQTLPKEEG